MSHLASFYRGKRVLVTGHTGFRGGWLVAWLKILGAQVCGYGLPPATRPNFFDATVLDRGITSIFADIRDRNALATAFSELQPEIVFHCAAHPEAHFDRDPVQTFVTNVLGTVHVLDEVRQTGSVRSLVIASRHASCELPSSSFAAAELAASAYVESFFAKTKTGVAITRTPGLIGGGDWADGRLLPGIVRSIASDESVAVSDGPAVAWQHVLDGTRAYLLWGKKLHEVGSAQSGTWNFAPAESENSSPAELAKRFVGRWGDANIQIELQNGAFAANSSPRVNTTTPPANFGWLPALRLEEAIAWTVEWYRSYYADPNSSCRVTAEQIERFMQLK